MKYIILSVLAALCLTGCGSDGVDMPRREIRSWECKWKTIQIEPEEILVVFFEAKHSQANIDFIKTCDNYEVISIEWTWRRYCRSYDVEAFKANLKVKKPFLLNWKYLDADGKETSMYTEIEFKKSNVVSGR